MKIKVEDWDKQDIEDFFKIIGKDHLEKYSESYNYAITDGKPKIHAGQKLITGEKKMTLPWWGQGWFHSLSQVSPYASKSS